MKDSFFYGDDYLEQIMQVIAEISLFPLAQDYDTLILDFVQRLRKYEHVQVTPGQTSTIIHGEYEQVFRMLEQECDVALNSGVKTALVIKILNTA